MQPAFPLSGDEYPYHEDLPYCLHLSDRTLELLGPQLFAVRKVHCADPLCPVVVEDPVEDHRPGVGLRGVQPLGGVHDHRSLALLHFTGQVVVVIDRQ